eukprot:TRINITY_DN40373_c0_g1_i1.p1 TRINITY_DN40373_c0_g1~~TRINITY_DN40373_c0_g1_i1.p1  ORF type:complete len:285 (-),score=48.20 TRINITY_DN40373_c0_g1_i1:587-1441(-)
MSSAEYRCFAAAAAGVALGSVVTYLACRQPRRRRRVDCKTAMKALDQLSASQSQPGPRILLIVTGSVAAVKTPQLTEKLANLHTCAAVAVVCSNAAEHFRGAASENYNAAACAKLRSLEEAGRVAFFTDDNEWEGYEVVGKDPVLHIELSKWAHCIVVAPCSANTLAKAALGLSDNLAACVLRASCPSVPVILAPAMNTIMWEHPCTAEHLTTLQARGCRVVPPVKKKLACQDVGSGALADLEDITAAVSTAVCARVEGVSDSRVGAWARAGFPAWDGSREAKA